MDNLTNNTEWIAKSGWESEDIDYTDLPKKWHGAMQRYMDYGISGGGFLDSLLSDLYYEATNIADPKNRELMHDIYSWAYHNAPPDSFGSIELVTKWKRQGGLNGHKEL